MSRGDHALVLHIKVILPKAGVLHQKAEFKMSLLVAFHHGTIP